MLALIAFAANSVLCRLALGADAIDAASFTVIRLISGVAILYIIFKATDRKAHELSQGSWRAGLMLFLYAITFSFAYISLDAGTGALILFAAVQITIIAVSTFRGQRLSLPEWAGVVIAFTGFVYLVLPGVSAPSTSGFLLMTVAGIAWGMYTLYGKGSTRPLADTAFNFIRTVPLALIVALIAITHAHYSIHGVVLAVLSGGVASGLGYTIWYSALRGLSATQAGIVQLLVPVIAAVGGILFISEAMTLRLLVSSLLIIGGIFFVIVGKDYFAKRT